MREHPEDVEWFKAQVRPRFWEKFVTEANATKPRGAPDIQRQLCYLQLFLDILITLTKDLVLQNIWS